MIALMRQNTTPTGVAWDWAMIAPGVWFMLPKGTLDRARLRR